MKFTKNYFDLNPEHKNYKKERKEANQDRFYTISSYILFAIGYVGVMAVIAYWI